jgi:hypothetical protein
LSGIIVFYNLLRKTIPDSRNDFIVAGVDVVEGAFKFYARRSARTADIRIRCSSHLSISKFDPGLSLDLLNIMKDRIADLLQLERLNDVALDA